MKRRVGILLATFVVATLVAVPVAAHVNDIRADPQVSPDATVVVETAFIGADGWLVLHADADGKPGTVVGHTRLSSEAGFQTDVSVSVDDDAWDRQDSAARLWVTLHREGGGSGFDPDDDPILKSFGRQVADQFTLGQGDRALVTARQFAPQTIEKPVVTIRRATLPADGYLVIHNASGGQRVGVRALEAGDHANVTVELDASFFDAQSRGRLNATLYVDNGNGEFDDADEPIRVDGATIRTTFGFRNGAYSTETTTGTPGSTSDGMAAGTTGTVGDSSTTAEESVVVTASPTPNGSLSPTETGTPGFSLTTAIIAVVAAALVAWNRA